jgi:hypothetical protein
MKIHLKKATEVFESLQDKNYLIHPISEIDAEIIVEIMEIFKKLGKSDLSAILDQWKYKKDVEIRDDLLQWNIDNGSIAGVQNSQSPLEQFINTPEHYITIENYNYSLNDIFGYGLIEEWNYTTNQPKYGIILNEIPTELKKVPLYANKKIFFEFRRDRDETYQLLDEKYRERNDIEFIN